MKNKLSLVLILASILLNLKAMEQEPTLNLSFENREQLTNTRLHDICSIFKMTKKLDLSFCSNITDIRDLANCTELEILNLYHCKQITNISALAHCTKLKTLYLNACPIADISALAYCTELETLNLMDCEQILDINALARCTKLKFLELSGCNKITNINALANCTELETLRFFGCEQPIDLSSLTNLKKLKVLNIMFSKQISIQQISNLRNAIPGIDIQLDFNEEDLMPVSGY